MGEERSTQFLVDSQIVFVQGRNPIFGPRLVEAKVSIVISNCRRNKISMREDGFVRTIMTVILGTLCIVVFTASAEAAQKKKYKKSCAQICSQNAGGMTNDPKYQACLDRCLSHRS
jgi:hypothetical protein